MAFASLPLIALLIFGVINFRKHPDAASQARFLRHAVFGFIAFVTVVFAVFLVA
jgi:hypothetical protein